MSFEQVVSLVAGLMVIGGLGWKLSNVLGEIKGTLNTFIATSTIRIDAIERRVDKVEERISKLEDSQVEIKLNKI